MDEWDRRDVFVDPTRDLLVLLGPGVARELGPRLYQRRDRRVCNAGLSATSDNVGVEAARCVAELVAVLNHVYRRAGLTYRVRELAVLGHILDLQFWLEADSRPGANDRLGEF